MFSKAALFISALAVSALAAPAPGAAPVDQCNTGAIQCCNSVQDAQSGGITAILSLLGVALDGITGQVGVTCSPISVIGIAGNSCTSQPVCCTNNNFNGVVALGCTPINLNL